MISAKERTHTSGEIVSDLNHRFKNYNKGTLIASQLSGGPPAGSDIELKLLGDDLSKLQTYGKEVSAYLEKQPGIEKISTSITSGASKIVFTPFQEKLTENDVSEEELNKLRTLFKEVTSSKQE